MNLEEFKNTLSPQEIASLKEAVQAAQPTEAQARAIFEYVSRSAESLGEDQIAEPFRYVLASYFLLRPRDLKALIGDDYDDALFSAWNGALGFPIVKNIKTPDTNEDAYGFEQALANALLKHCFDDQAALSYRSDIAYYLLDHVKDPDPVRSAVCFSLFIQSDDPVGMARLISQSSFNVVLRHAVMLLGNMFQEGHPLYRKRDLCMKMVLVEDSQVDLTKVLTILSNDVIGTIGKAEWIMPYAEQLNQHVQTRVNEHPELALFLPLTLLRIAQAHRILKHDEDARSFFDNALRSITQPLSQIDPKEIDILQFEQIWNALKICQEMAQPKAMEMLFQALSKAERGAIGAEGVSPERKAQLESMVHNQYIDMARTYWTMPKPLQEQFVDHSEETIVLLRAFLADETNRAEMDEFAVANYYMTIADLSQRLNKENDVYEALTEAQIIQMHHLGDLQKRDGEQQMSTDQLVARLQLSVTNHMLADHYRRIQHGNHELSILLQSNMDMSKNCFEHFPLDPRVIHFIINASLELGDFQHQSHGFLTESKTYQSVIELLVPKLNNLRLDQQLAIDVAMLHSKAGQLQAGQLRDYSHAVPNLTLAEKLWRSLAENTKNEQFKKNADVMKETLNQIRPKDGKR